MATDELEFLRHSRLLVEAYETADRVHTGQREESDGQPYIDHPVEVARMLCDAGCDEEVVAAGLLHDTLERSELTAGELRERFGERVADLVTAMTEPDGVEPFEARKQALRAQIAAAGRDAEAIMAADKISKSSSLRRALAQHGEGEVARRVANPLDAKLSHYHASLRQLEALAADLPLTARLQSELDAIDRQRLHDKDLEVARAALARLGALDAPGLVSLCDAEVVWWPALTLGDGGGPYRGHTGLARYVADLSSSWAPFSIELTDARALDGRMLVLCTIRGRGRRSHRAVARSAAVVFRVRDRLVLAAQTLLGGALSA